MTGLNRLRIDIKFTDFKCSIFQFEVGWSFVWEPKPTNPPCGDMQYTKLM